MRMDEIETIQPDGIAVCQPGVRLGVLENEARKRGWELRCYPSTIIKASLGGFLGGGSGGIGSVANGSLRDFNTVRAMEVVTMEPEPRARPARGRGRPRNSACMGHQRGHHAHLAFAHSRRRLVAMRCGFQLV